MAIVLVALAKSVAKEMLLQCGIYGPYQQPLLRGPNAHHTPPEPFTDDTESVFGSLDRIHEHVVPLSAFDLRPSDSSDSLILLTADRTLDILILYIFIRAQTSLME